MKPESIGAAGQPRAPDRPHLLDNTQLRALGRVARIAEVANGGYAIVCRIEQDEIIRRCRRTGRINMRIAGCPLMNPGADRQAPASEQRWKEWPTRSGPPRAAC